jgi:hypothetical protein
MAFKFIKIPDKNNRHDVASVEICVDSGEVTLAELVEVFSAFLRACDFSLNDLEIVQKETELKDSDEVV